MNLSLTKIFGPNKCTVSVRGLCFTKFKPGFNIGGFFPSKSGYWVLLQLWSLSVGYVEIGFTEDQLKTTIDVVQD